MTIHPEFRPLALALAMTVLLPLSGRSQMPQDRPADDPFDPPFGDGPYEEMSALLEVTIFNIDVLTLAVRVPPEAARRIGSIVEGREYSEALADSVAAVVLGADQLWARQVFERDVGFGRLIGGMRESSEKAAEAGYVSWEHHEAFSADVESWFGFLREDGVKKGDEIVFRVRGDTVRTLFRTADGRVLLDEQGVDADGRNGSVPSFFAPGSRFRKRLVESLLEPRSAP